MASQMRYQLNNSLGIVNTQNVIDIIHDPHKIELHDGNKMWFKYAKR